MSAQPVRMIWSFGQARADPVDERGAGLDVGEARVDQDDVRVNPFDGLEGGPHVAGGA